ncbi:hypothetical protein HPP92_020087 [Vanilla planifolia]|uniref:Chloride channel protein n=1 Tax=Vanilla planifolia TaxID=51239 RepID=A0A835UJS3_VANPL|nr:hypothetical protein HPP92_020087 [Vanilla planifolia]
MATAEPVMLELEEEESIWEPLLEHRPVNLRRFASNSTSQVAIIGSNLCPIESLDYEIMENDFFKQDWRSRGQAHIVSYVILKWTLCLLIGVISGAVGFFNNLAIENLAGIKLLCTSNLMVANKYLMAFGVFAVTNFVLTMLAVTITSSIAPASAGSGIPEVRAYLNGVDAPDIFSPSTFLVKIFGCIATVSSLHVGKAGPMVHIGASIGALFGQGRLCKGHLTGKWLKHFNNDRDRRDLVTCGASAGVAAAFRSPVGGVLFALDSLSSWWRSSLLWRAFFTTAIVAIVLRALIDVCIKGKCGLFGKGGLIMFDVTSTSVVYHLVDLLFVVLLGIIGGVLGCFYNFLMEKVLQLYSSINEKGTKYRLLLGGTISIVTSSVLFGLPWFASCQPCPDSTKERCPTGGKMGNFHNFQCPPNYYNDLASLFFNTNDDTIRNLYSSGNELFDPFSIILCFIASYFLGVISYGVVAPAGLFVPVILTGAIYGRFIGMLMGSRSNLDHGLYAVLGSASFLGGTMRMTVSVCVIILELTNNLLLLPLVMLVLLISKAVADSFNENIYGMILKLKGLPYLEGHAEPYMRQLTVSDVVMGPLCMFNGVEKVGNIVHVLKATGHNGFPVIDGTPISSTPYLFGIILRSHLLVLLRKRNFLPTCALTSIDLSKEYSSDDFVKYGYVKPDCIEDIELTEEEMEMFIDLHPFTNTSPYTVVETMSLAKALILFREVGLRHLLIIPKHNRKCPLVGILTRHDFMPEHIFGLHPTLMKSRFKKLRFEESTLIRYLWRILLSSSHAPSSSMG